MEHPTVNSIVVDIFRNLKVSKAGASYAIKVKALPFIEEFMKSLGDGKSQHVEAWGKDWLSVPEPDGVVRPLMIYTMNDLSSAHSQGYTLDNPGHPIYSYHEDGLFNLSFLRIVGISDGDGVTFGMSTPANLTMMETLRDQVNKYVGQFFRDYIRPVHLQVVVSTRELSC